MLDMSKEYYAAITADARRILLRAIIDIIDPDIVYGSVGSQSLEPWAKPDQMYDKIFVLSPAYATLERNRWLLDGSFKLLPDNNNHKAKLVT